VTNSRVHRVTIDEEGVHVREPDYIVRARAKDAMAASQITAAANAHGFYGDDANRFCREVDNATEFLIRRVAAAGGDKRRFRDRRSRAKMREECLRQAGVPEAYWPSLWTTIKSLIWAVPPPWNIVIAAVVVAVERYLGGQA
jgi:hypothetical protein